MCEQSIQQITDGKPTCKIKLFFIFSISFKDGHFMNWFRFLFNAMHTSLTVRDTVDLFKPRLSPTTCRKLPDVKNLKAMRTCCCALSAWLAGYHELNPHEVGLWCNLLHFCQTYISPSTRCREGCRYLSLVGDIVFHDEYNLLGKDWERDPPLPKLISNPELNKLTYLARRVKFNPCFNRELGIT